MLKKIEKIEFLAASVASVLTITPVFAASLSLPAGPGEMPVKNMLVQNTGAEAVFQEGLNFAAQRNMAEAEAAFRRAIQINPNFAEAYGNLGSILANQNKLAEAIPYFENAIRISPNVPEFHYMKARTLLAQNKKSEAVDSMKRARDLFIKQGKTQEANTLEQMLKAVGSL